MAAEKSIESVLARVKKMIALGTDSGATEGERENAMRMAHNVLAKYNLTMSDLPEEQEEARERNVITVCADKWFRVLAMQVSKLCFCNYCFSRTSVSGKDQHHFIGRQSNVATATYMAEYLLKGIRREASARFGGATTPQGRAFCCGATSSISNRIAALLKGGVEGVPGTALVVADLHVTEDAANTAWMSQTGIVVREQKARAQRPVDAFAYYDGQEYGQQVSLNKQLT